MIELHDVLCPPFIECDICDTNRKEIKKNIIIEFLDVSANEDFFDKHFYYLKISVTPTRETYYHFSLEPIKKVARELINGLSSLSSVSNRKWWGLFVEAGIRYFSIEQPLETMYPTFNHNFIFYSNKDNLDIRMDTQLKYRLKKISKYFNYSLEYIGKYDLEKIESYINVDVSVNHSSLPMIKLGEDIQDEIYKLKSKRPVLFGSNQKVKKSLKRSKDYLIEVTD